MQHIIKQHTIKKDIIFTGIGVHTGQMITMTISPSDINTGIVFERSDITNKYNVIPAKYENVTNTKLCTVIGNKNGVEVSTIEHLMFAFYACSITNAYIKVDGPEIPIMDGSGKAFMESIMNAGIVEQSSPMKVVKIIKEINIHSDDDKYIKIIPNNTFSVDFTINFSQKTIGAQNYIFSEDTKKDYNNYVSSRASKFYTDIAIARTFGFSSDLKQLQANGFGLGASLENTVGIDHINGNIMNNEGLRCANEFVKHKILDLIGDFYLSGYFIIGKVIAYKSGHRFNNIALHTLFKTPDAYKIIDMEKEFNYDINIHTNTNAIFNKYNNIVA